MLPEFSSIPKESYIAVSGFNGINILPSDNVAEIKSASNMSFNMFPAMTSRKARNLNFACNGTINGSGYFRGFFCTYSRDNKIFLKTIDKPVFKC